MSGDEQPSWQDPAVSILATYWVIEDAQQCQVEVVLPCALSNYCHAVIFDRWGRYPEFLEHFTSYFARSQNALRERWRTSGRPSRSAW